MPTTELHDGLCDADLLKHFATGREEAAFAELVHRHGRLVWSVCRRRLDNRQDAEDAFQATFLILAMKAGTIRQPAALAGWLHRTATRATLRVASSSSREGVDEAVTGGLDAFGELARREAIAAIDEELVRLPRRYRDAIVLFHFDGLSRGQVAERLGISDTAVKSLLSRGRSLLRSRLTRRGVALPLLLPLAIEPVPAEAATATIRSAVSMARSGLSPLDLLSVPAKGLPPMITWFSNKTAAAVLIGAACLSLFLVGRGTAEMDGPAASKAMAGPTIETALAQVDDTSDKPAVPVTAETDSAEIDKSLENPAKPAAARTTPEFEVASPAVHHIRNALEVETELVFPNTPLRTALDFLGDSHNINILIDETALTDEGISLDDPIDLAIMGIPLESGLNILLDPFGLTYTINNDVMVITTKLVAESKTDIRAYDVSRLMQGQLRQPAQVGELVTQLLTPITTSRGGEGPVIAVHENRLLVTGSLADHRKISEILRLLHAAPTRDSAGTQKE